MPPKSSTIASGIERFLDCELAGEIEFLRHGRARWVRHAPTGCLPRWG